MAIAASTTAHVGVGSTFGPYEIIARLTGGGMASVYLARRGGAQGFARPVGIKVIHPHLAESPDFVDMFIDEAKLAARIQHPNVVHVEELGERDGVLFIAMEFVLGASVSQLLKARAVSGEFLDPALMVWVAMQALSGLHAAHELKDKHGNMGLVHRDVSPQNILIASDGNVKVIDFGIAKARGRHHHTETGSGSLKGKLRYMAPEQARSAEVDRRTDIYALGVVLWEMLALRRLFDAPDDFRLMEQISRPEVKPPSSIAPNVPEALDQVVLKALAPEPDDRFESALAFRRALAQAMPSVASVDANRLAVLLQDNLGGLMAKRRDLLAACMAGEPVHEKPDSRELVTRSASGLRATNVSIRRTRRIAVGFGIAILASLSFGLTFAFWKGNSHREPTPAVVAPTTPPAAPVPEPADSPTPVAETQTTEAMETIEAVAVESMETEPTASMAGRTTMAERTKMRPRMTMHMRAEMEPDDRVDDDVPIFDDGF